jgi:methylase of polypeptide subunit release factors
MSLIETIQGDHGMLHWQEDGADKSARFISESQHRAPGKVVIADDRTTADTAFRLASEGHALLWRGDFQNARQLLNALARRTDRKPLRAGKDPAEIFLFVRQARAQRARTLGMLMIELDENWGIGLRRAPDLSEACREALGAATGRSIVPLRELLGMIGAHEWRRTGIEIPGLDGRIHPHYGVFAPVRNEYVSLVARAPLADVRLGFDIGTGTGVLAGLLARRGVQKVIATEIDQRAADCALDNLARLGLGQVEVQVCDLFPEGKANLIVCNPPWIPARPTSSLEHAVYDPNNKMLLGFLNGAAARLEPGGEAWLILSDLAEHLGLRSREWLLDTIKNAGLVVEGRLDARPTHRKSNAGEDPLAFARKKEVTSLWRLSASQL